MVFLYPLDYIQYSLLMDVGSVPRFKGSWDVIVQTYNKTGIMGFYNGIGISILGIFVYRGVYFGLYDILKVILIIFLCI